MECNSVEPLPPTASASLEDLPAVDERDEQSASERYETDGEHSTSNDQPPIKGTSGPAAVEVDSKHRLSQSSHVDSSTVALPPVFQSLPSYFPAGFFATRSHPWNRSGFRYLACGPSVDQQPQDTDHPIYYTIETVPTGVVKWSWEDRSSYVYITKDGLSVTTDRGFRSARANCPIREGRWYFEVTMVRAGGELNQGSRSDPEEAHVRVGIARRETGLNAPLGIDGYSYGIRDKTGEKVHLSRPQRYGEPFRSGDVIGILVDLPKMRKPRDDDLADPARIERKRIPIRYRRQLYFESTEYPISKEMEDLADSALPSKLKPKQEETPLTPKKKTTPGQTHEKKTSLQSEPKAPPPRALPVLKGSKLIFFKNGVCQGVAFEDLLDFLPLRADHRLQNNEPENQANNNLINDPNLNPKSGETLHDDGTLGYFPCVSVYGGGIAQLNAGPGFKFAPSSESVEYLFGKKQDMLEKDDTSNGHDQPVKEEALSEHGNRSWRPLSELYPIYLAEQRKLDQMDANESQKQLAETNLPVDTSNKSKGASSKRKRVSSPSLTAVYSARGKKKGKLAMNGESLQPHAFKPSPLGNVEAFEEDPVDNQATAHASTGLSILCQVATSGSIASTTHSKTVDQLLDPSDTPTNDPVKTETSFPPAQVLISQTEPPTPHANADPTESERVDAATVEGELIRATNGEGNIVDATTDEGELVHAATGESDLVNAATGEAELVNASPDESELINATTS